MKASKFAIDFEQIVETYAGLVARIASTYEARHALAEELVQDIFLAVWRALRSFRGDASLKTFVARIAHNVCASHVRREVRRKSEPLEESQLDLAPSAEADAHEADARARMLDAVRALKLPDRQLITLHLEGFSNREIADVLDISEGNAAVRLTRLRATLKKQVNT